MRLSPQAIRSADERSEALSRSESHKNPRHFGNASGPMPLNLNSAVRVSLSVSRAVP